MAAWSLAARLRVWRVEKSAGPVLAGPARDGSRWDELLLLLAALAE
jgi:hypothetical protein